MLKIPEDLNALVENLQSTASKYSNINTGVSENGNSLRIPGHVQNNAHLS